MTSTVMVTSRHDFRTQPGHPGADGANSAYEELGRLLDAAPGTHTRLHDITELVRDEVCAEECLRDVDCVVATAGPHAYVYHYLRELLGLDFRIVRDVRTLLWSGYLLQEYLCAPFVRRDDVVIHSTAFSADVVRHVLPAGAQGTTAVAYPLFASMPPEFRGAWQGHRSSDVLWVGRISRDKGFDDLLAACTRARDGGWVGRLIVAGEVKEPALLEQLSVESGVVADVLGVVPRTQLWHLYCDVGKVVFPSTSSLETFGRVVAEASHVGVPVLAPRHGASRELVPRDATCPALIVPQRFDSRNSVALARVCTDSLAELLVSDMAGLAPTIQDRYCYQVPHYLDTVHGRNDVLPDDRPDGPDPLLGRLATTTPMGANADEVRAAVATLRRLTFDLRGKTARRRLLEGSDDPAATERFLERLDADSVHLTNIGTVDAELARQLHVHFTVTVNA